VQPGLGVGAASNGAGVWRLGRDGASLAASLVGPFRRTAGGPPDRPGGWLGAPSGAASRTKRFSHGPFALPTRTPYARPGPPLRPARGEVMSRFFHTCWQFCAGWVFMCVWIPAILVVGAVTLGRRKDTLGSAMMRGFGKAGLAIAGVRLELDDATQATLRRRCGRVLTFNHSSTLDLFIGAALMPEGGVTVVKRELLRVPLIGQAIWVLNVIPIDRKNRAQTTAVLERNGQRLRRERLSAVMAPEGTRSKSGELGPFKMGAFHLAIGAGVPVVPMVFHGAATLWPRGRRACSRGTVRVEILPEISTAGLGADDARALAETTRAAYLQAMARAE
jgi:1-acyl-sn-glycerol-3-phosphate acyltransferase